MNPAPSIVRLIGTSLLAVIASASLVLALFMLLAARVTGLQLGGWVADSATGAVLIVAVLALVYAGVAGYAARAEWMARPLGRMLGLAVAVIAILAAGTTLLVGSATDSAPLLFLAIGLGVATAVAMLLPDCTAA